MPKSLKRIENAIKRSALAGKIAFSVAGAGGTTVGLAGGGLAAFQGLLAAAGTATVAEAVAAVGLTAVVGAGAVFAGGAMLVGVGGYALYRGIRGRSRKAHSQKGKGKPLSGRDLSNPYWSCYFSSVAIIGVRGTGKTELKNYFRSYQPPDPKSTRGVEIHLVELEEKSEKYAAFLDGEGAQSKSIGQ